MVGLTLSPTLTRVQNLRRKPAKRLVAQGLEFTRQKHCFQYVQGIFLVLAPCSLLLFFGFPLLVLFSSLAFPLAALRFERDPTRTGQPHGVLPEFGPRVGELPNSMPKSTSGALCFFGNPLLVGFQENPEGQPPFWGSRKEDTHVHSSPVDAFGLSLDSNKGTLAGTGYESWNGRWPWHRQAEPGRGWQ